MRICLKSLAVCATVLVVSGGVSPLAAQEAPQTPLSAIDWLGTQSTVQPTALVSNEPDVTKNGLPPEISVTTLDRPQLRKIGLVPSSVTGLPETLWQGSESSALVRLVTSLPDVHLPAAQSLKFMALLAEAWPPDAPANQSEAFTLARVQNLVEAGALDPALALIEQAGVTRSPAHFELWMQISLLTGAEDAACSVLAASPHLAQDYGTRIFCAARKGDWENAALTFGSAQALKLMNDADLMLFDRFLHPEAFEGAHPLPVPPSRALTALKFRVFEAIGEPLPTGNLPRAFAVADLRDLAGWKAQLGAAERLTRAGVLPDNRLLGLYTERQAAASGGIWDRVAALQRFETALGTQSTQAVQKTLPKVWREMQQADLEVVLASLFADRLSGMELTGQAQKIAANLGYLSPDYESWAHALPDSAAKGIAQGAATGPVPARPLDAALHAAFSAAKPRADLVAMVQQNRLGEAILRLIVMLESGANGDLNDLTQALATLRAIGLENVARQSALQILLLNEA